MLSNKTLVIGLLTILQLVECLGLLAEACNNDHQVDYLMLAITWQPGACKSGKVKCKGFSNQFSIHGFWPQKHDGTLENCCTKEFYLDKKIEKIKRSLKTYWPTITPGREDHAWEYQFNKHGSCAIGKVRGANNLIGYFSQAIDEFKKFDLERALLDGGYKIKTSSVYNGSDIIQFLKQKFGYEFQIACDSKGHSKFVVEIRACYDTKLNQIDCKYTKKACKGPLTFQ